MTDDAGSEADNVSGIIKEGNSYAITKEVGFEAIEKAGSFKFAVGKATFFEDGNEGFSARWGVADFEFLDGGTVEVSFIEDVFADGFIADETGLVIFSGEL